MVEQKPELVEQTAGLIMVDRSKQQKFGNTNKRNSHSYLKQ